MIGIFGFDPQMDVAFWITQQGGETIGGTRTIHVNEEGVFVGTISTRGRELAPGDYIFVAKDVGQKYCPSIAPFRVLP